MNRYILAIDQGTTSSRAIVFDQNAKIAGLGQQAFQQFYPQDGWVEHDPEEIWQTTLASCKTAIQKAGLQPADITTAGITNQRETTIVWDKNTDKPVYNAIVWQDRRTAQFCKKLKAQGMESSVQEKTGLLLDPYFSASKISWILDNVPDARSNAEKGTLVFGTVDSYLLWRLSGGKRHATDVTNASRTLLYNIHEQCWDEDLLSLFGIPKSMMPEVLDCAAEFSTIDKDLLGSPIPVQGVAGDQQAAAFGQCCFSPGMAKSTYGTGCFLLLNTGNEAIQSNNRLLTTIAYRLENKCHYALEGSIFMAGATMQWIRDGIKLIDDTSESETLARQTGEDLSVYLVPAFTGLGAPYWDPDARGAIFGLTRDTGIREIVTAALLSVAYQSRDLQQALVADGATLTSMRVDGGMAANSYLMQFLADILDCRIDRPAILETTALGAAFLAGLQAGIFNSLDDIAGTWKADTTFQSARDADWRERRYAGWLDAIGRTRSRED